MRCINLHFTLLTYLLVGSSWGASATTLRTSALALCYSTAEYCAPVWARSPYTKLIDVQLNESMHTVSGTLCPTPLPVLRHITPPRIRRMAATNQLLGKIRSSAVTLPLISDIESHPEVRLTSRRQVWLDEPQQEEVSPWQKWTEEWAASDVVNRSLIVDPSVAPPGFDLRRCMWSTLNHFRTGQGRCAANLIRWNQALDPSCSCGACAKFPGGLSALHLADEEAIAWLGMQSIR